MGGRLDSHVAVVVGASSGIGRAVARRFGAAGVDVVATARSTDRADAVAQAINDDGGTALAVACDLTDQVSVDRTVETTVEEFGGLDIAFNSAGAITRGEIVETDETDMDRVLDVNLRGPMRLAKAALPELVEREGTLINVSSEAGERGIENLPVYCASKGGLNTLTKQLAVAYGPKGVNVNAIAPGTTKTAMNEQVRRENPEWIEKRREAIPIGRVNEPEEVAELAVYLASEAAKTVNGAVVNIDGGTTAR
jgi:NAD(P)-dependent dehydrogenase (short-subunit alcohol dehydrogenase family)